MDLGIKGKKAIVCAASKGLGKGCAQALAREGVDVTICARGAEALNATAKELASAGVKVTPVVCDVTTEAGRKALLRRLPEPRHSHQQRRRTAPGRLQGLLARGLAQGGGGQHDHAHRPHPRHRLRHDGARLRPHRQHHLGLDQAPDRGTRAVQRRTPRPHRRGRRAGAQGQRQTSRSTASCRGRSTPTGCAAPRRRWRRRARWRSR